MEEKKIHRRRKKSAPRKRKIHLQGEGKNKIKEGEYKEEKKNHAWLDWGVVVFVYIIHPRIDKKNLGH